MIVVRCLTDNLDTKIFVVLLPWGFSPFAFIGFPAKRFTNFLFVPSIPTFTAAESIPVCTVTLCFISRDLSDDQKNTLHSYIELISLRASGRAPTAAERFRRAVRGHPDYKGDSRVPERAVYDYLTRISNRRVTVKPFGQAETEE